MRTDDFHLERIILIDSYRQGDIVEVRLDGHVNVNGINAAGKTTLLRTIPLFYGELAARMLKGEQSKKAFTDHYLPRSTSYIVFEYARRGQLCMAVLHSNATGESVQYRFIATGYSRGLFVVGQSIVESNTQLYRHVEKNGFQCTRVLTRSEYRSIIQNDVDHRELRSLAAQFAFTDSYEDEISQTVFEINDSLQGFITNLQANIETRFAAVTSLAAKKLQNEFYLNATHTLVNVLESFHLSDILERIQAFPRIETLLRTQLFARIPVFRSTLQTIYETLRLFLFEFRKIEARAKRIQQMWLFLKKTPDYEPRVWDNASDLPAWLERSPGLPIATHPDVSDTACEDTLVELAQSIKADQSPRKRREAGALTAEEVPAKVIVKVPAHVLALRQMLKDAKASEAPVSVRQWRAQHATELELDDTLWLELALDVLAKKTSITKGLEVGYNEHSREGPFSTGNILIKDLSLWKSA